MHPMDLEPMISPSILLLWEWEEEVLSNNLRGTLM